MFKVDLLPGEHFQPPADSIVPREDGSFDLYITKSLCLRFDSMMMIHQNEPKEMDIITLLSQAEIVKDAPRVIGAKIQSFEGKREEKIRRFFAGYADSIFFSEDEMFKLSEFFSMMYLYAFVSIKKDGLHMPIEDLDKKEFELVIFWFKKLGVISEVSVLDEVDFRRTRRVKRILTKKDIVTRKGVRSMNKAELVGRTVGGAAVFAFGSIITMSGGLAMKKSLSALMGLEKEIVLVEDVPFEEDTDGEDNSEE